MTKSRIDQALPKKKQYTIWCSELKGFGICINPAGSKAYVVDYRNIHGRRRRMTLGRFGVISTDKARNLAITKLAEAIQGQDPMKERQKSRNITKMSELCQTYIEAMKKGLILGKGGKPKKQSTIDTDIGRINRHIIPLLGNRPIADLGKADISKFIRDVASGKTACVKNTEKLRGKSVVTGGHGTATRTAGLLGGVLSYAVSEGIIEFNPVAGVRKPAYKKRIKRLSRQEYAALGSALQQRHKYGETDQAIYSILLLALTGCRRGEIIGLKWSDVDLQGNCLRLSDSKEGRSVRPIGKAACVILNSIDAQNACNYVFPPIRSGEYFGGLPRAWKRVVSLAGLKDLYATYFTA